MRDNNFDQVLQQCFRIRMTGPTVKQPIDLDIWRSAQAAIDAQGSAVKTLAIDKHRPLNNYRNDGQPGYFHPATQAGKSFQRNGSIYGFD